MYCVERLRVRDGVMSSHDAYTSGTFRVLTVALLQRLKMEALNLAPADCEMRSMVKVLNIQSITPIEIHRQLFEVNGPNIMSMQMVRRYAGILQQVDNMYMIRSAVEVHPSLHTTLWSF